MLTINYVHGNQSGLSTSDDIKTLSITKCKSGELGHECTYTKGNRSFENIGTYKISVKTVADERYSRNDIHVHVKKPSGIPVGKDWNEKLGTLLVVAPGVMEPKYEVTGQAGAPTPLIQSTSYVHIDAAKVDELKFCANNIMKPNTIKIDEVIAAAGDICVQTKINTTVRTVHELSYTETDNCKRTGSFTLYLTSCATVEHKVAGGRAKALTYSQTLSQDRCLRIDGKDTWSVHFFLDVPNDCFKPELVLKAIDSKSDPASPTSKSIRTFDLKNLTYTAGGPQRKNMKKYEIDFTKSAAWDHSEFFLEVVMLDKDESRRENYVERLGQLDVTAAVVKGSYQIPGITPTNVWVDLVEDNTVDIAAFRQGQAQSQLVYCVNNLLGEKTLTIDGHKDTKRHADNCVYVLLQLKLEQMALRYREDYKDCSDRSGVFYLRIKEQPLDEPEKIPVILPSPPSIPDSTIRPPTTTTQPVTTTPRTKVTLSVLHIVLIVAGVFVVIVSIIAYFIYCGGTAQPQMVPVAMPMAAPVAMEPDPVFSSTMMSSSVAQTPTSGWGTGYAGPSRQSSFAMSRGPRSSQSGSKYESSYY